jgi:hypothetical protein
MPGNSDQQQNHGDDEGQRSRKAARAVDDKNPDSERVQHHAAGDFPLADLPRTVPNAMKFAKLALI